MSTIAMLQETGQHRRVDEHRSPTSIRTGRLAARAPPRRTAWPASSKAAHCARHCNARSAVSRVSANAIPDRSHASPAHRSRGSRHHALLRWGHRRVLGPDWPRNNRLCLWRRLGNPHRASRSDKAGRLSLGSLRQTFAPSAQLKTSIERPSRRPDTAPRAPTDSWNSFHHVHAKLVRRERSSDAL